MRRCTIVAMIVACLVGCRGSVDTDRVERREERVPIRREAAAASDEVAAILDAPTAAAEADAIRALRKSMVDRGQTYTIRTIRTDGNVVVDDPSVLPPGVPVLTEVTIFRGREVVRTFQFVPRDNRNLALFGE